MEIATGSWRPVYSSRSFLQFCPCADYPIVHQAFFNENYWLPVTVEELAFFFISAGVFVTLYTKSVV